MADTLVRKLAVTMVGWMAGKMVVKMAAQTVLVMVDPMVDSLAGLLDPSLAEPLAALSVETSVVY